MIDHSVLGEVHNKICSDRNPQNCKNISCSTNNLEGNHTKQQLDCAVNRRFSESTSLKLMDWPHAKNHIPLDIDVANEE